MRMDDPDLDQRLAGLAAEGARHARPPAPATIRRRSRRRRQRQAAGVVLVAVALTGTVVAVQAARPAPAPPAGPRPSPTTVAPASNGQLVPWIAAPARPTPDHPQGPAAVPAGTPACMAGQLQATAGWQGATGSLVGAVRFTSRGRGTAPCFLVGYPTLGLLDRRGRPLRLVGDPRSGKEAPPPVLLRPGLAAHVEFAWFNWCGPSPGPVGLRVILPRGGTLVPTVTPDTRRELTPRCDASASPSTLSRGPFVAEQPEPPPDPLGSLNVRVTLPPSVVAGQPLRYTVTLANPTTAAVSLRDCPDYEERVSLENGGTAAQRHLLNCAPVAAVGPGQKVTFAMVLDLPATLRPGKGVLVWQLLREPPPGTKALVTVIGP